MTYALVILAVVVVAALVIVSRNLTKQIEASFE